MTIEQLRDRCAYWQKRLRLQDWDVLLEFKRSTAMSKAERVAETEYMWILKRAKVALVDPVDADATGIWFKPIDPERSLVHELLHLHFAPFEADEGTDKLADQELAIEMIVEALVGLDRERFGPVTTIPKVEPDALVDMLGAPIIVGNGTG